jgi:hypothetical protein
MALQESAFEQCPYCGESIEFLVDLSQGSTSYTEDCEVCCRPILVYVTVNDEDDVYEAEEKFTLRLEKEND